MQTFLAYPQYMMAAGVLDKQRLNKQITECYQIRRALATGSGWSNHPATRMWAGWEPSLFRYTFWMYDEFVRRGGAKTHKSWHKYLAEFPDDRVNSPSPDWLGQLDFHASHRARLLHKGNLDVVRKRLRALGHRKADVFVTEFFGEKLALRDVSVGQEQELRLYLDRVEAPGFDNWYEQFNWREEPSDDYIWPTTGNLRSRSNA